MVASGRPALLVCLRNIMFHVSIRSLHISNFALAALASNGMAFSREKQFLRANG